jgi:hypothetical protein
MSDFSLHHRQAAANAPAGFTPKAGDLVSAKFSEDNQWSVDATPASTYLMNFKVPRKGEEIERVEEGGLAAVHRLWERGDAAFFPHQAAGRKVQVTARTGKGSPAQVGVLSVW